MNSPRILIIRVTEACNAGCFMCAFARSTDTYRFTAADASELAEKLCGSTYRIVRLTGGEPLQLADIGGVVWAFSSSGMITSLITNGWFLSEKAAELTACGLRQVIVSLDGASAESHDRYRACPGLFTRACQGIEALRLHQPRISIRVNTVVGPHNLSELADLHRLLQDLDIDLWSIIPLKRNDGSWEYESEGEFRDGISRFRSAIAASTRPRMVGYSATWFGRNEEELLRLLHKRLPFTPRDRCGVVDILRYYTPKEGFVYPCNCVPHRLGSTALGEHESISGFRSDGLEASRGWLKVNGPTWCTGCESANAALGEGLIDIQTDPFGF